MMVPTDADGIAISKDPNQTAMLDQPFLSKYL